MDLTRIVTRACQSRAQSAGASDQFVILFFCCCCCYQQQLRFCCCCPRCCFLLPEAVSGAPASAPHAPRAVSTPPPRTCLVHRGRWPDCPRLSACQNAPTPAPASAPPAPLAASAPPRPFGAVTPVASWCQLLAVGTKGIHSFSISCLARAATPSSPSTA